MPGGLDIDGVTACAVVLGIDGEAYFGKHHKAKTKRMIKTMPAIPAKSFLLNAMQPVAMQRLAEITDRCCKNSTSSSAVLRKPSHIQVVTNANKMEKNDAPNSGFSHLRQFAGSAATPLASQELAPPFNSTSLFSLSISHYPFAFLELPSPHGADDDLYKSLI